MLMKSSFRVYFTVRVESLFWVRFKDLWSWLLTVFESGAPGTNQWYFYITPVQMNESGWVDHCVFFSHKALLSTTWTEKGNCASGHSSNCVTYKYLSY